MYSNTLMHKLTVLAGFVMMSAGLGLGIWAITHFPLINRDEPSALAAASASRQSPLASLSILATPTTARPTTVPIAAPANAPTLFVAAALPRDLQTNLEALAAQGSISLVVTEAASSVRLDWEETRGEPIFSQFFAAATRFDTIDLNLRRLHLERAWQGDTRTFTQVAVLSDTLPALTQLLGPPADTVIGRETVAEIIDAAWENRTTLALLPFDLLTPELAVFNVDGQTPVENPAKFNPAAYPLIATVYAHPADSSAPIPPTTWEPLIDALPPSNRDSNRLTVVAMTGVTAMVRLTAAEMDQRGAEWPADIVGPELAAADITAISNEVPFVPDCETNTSEDNLVFCSKPEYMATLPRVGCRHNWIDRQSSE